jgi:hypothetical protein
MDIKQIMQLLVCFYLKLLYIYLFRNIATTLSTKIDRENWSEIDKNKDIFIIFRIETNSKC